MATIKTKGADEALRRTESIVESAAQAILAVGPDGKIVLANAMTEKMFGYSRAELLGKPLTILIPKDARQRHMEYHKLFLPSREIGRWGALILQDAGKTARSFRSRSA